MRLRELVNEHRDLAQKIDALEKRYDTNFEVVFQAIRELVVPEAPARKRRIGYLTAGAAAQVT